MEAELSLSEYWGIVRKRRIAVLAVVGAGLAATFIASLGLKPRFRADAIIKYEPPLPAAMSGDFSALAMPAVIQTQVSLLQSEDMRQRLAGRLSVTPEEAGRLYQVAKVGTSSLISIVASGPDKEKVASIANSVGETFVEWDLETRSTKVKLAIAEIKSRQKSLEAQLQKLETSRRLFQESHETTGLSGAIATQLLELENRRKELERKFTDLHPDMIKLDSRIRNMRGKLAAMPAEQEELLRLNREIAVIEGTFIELAKELERKKIEADSTLSFVSIVSRAVTPEKPYFPNIPMILFGGGLGALFLGVLSAFVLESLDISITTIEEIEKIMGAPVLAVIPHFGSSDRWEDLLQFLRVRARVDEVKFRGMLAFRFGSKSPNIEVYHGMRVNIQAQLGRPTGNVLAFTSTGVAEGKTLTSTNFCLAAASSGLKTLLVAADIRRPTLHKVFGFPRQPGLVEALTGRVPWRAALRSTVDILMGEGDLERLVAFPNIDNLRIMTGWAEAPADAVNLFGTDAFARMVREMRSEFDLVVFDLPPVLLFVDAMLVSKHTDGAVMVYRSGKIGRRALRRAKEQIELSQSRIVGIALNDARAAELDPGYATYGDYGHYAKPSPDKG